MARKHIRTDVTDAAPYGPEQDACAIYMSARKHGQSTYGTLKRALSALVHMGHRTGFVEGEGDGAGVQTDIPRQLWSSKLSTAGLRSSLATYPGFWVGHLFVPHDADFETFRDEVTAAFSNAGLNLLLEQPGRIRPEALGRSARRNPPSFWQLCGHSDTPDLEKRLFAVQKQIETNLPVSFASLSSHTVVYKLRGSVEALSRYYPDLQDRTYDTKMALCHARYSTNTVSSFERSQPFALLGHNGEINTISRFRQEAIQINTTLPYDGSDSQDVDRAMHTLCVDYGLDLMEAMELIFPPVPHELELMPPALRAVYTRMRQSYGPYAQGPAAIVARYGDIAVFSVDALGLRPLWFCETEKEYIFSSERGAIPLENVVSDSRAIAPGEKMALRVNRGHHVDVLNHTQIRQHVMNTAFQREAPQLALRYWAGQVKSPDSGVPEHQQHHTTPVREALQSAPDLHLAHMVLPQPVATPWENPTSTRALDTAVLAAAGWQREHLREIDALASTGKDLVGSLGFDGPLALLSRNRVNLADFFKETVAVVTNPAIDRDREAEAFSTSTLIGARPVVGKAPAADDILITLDTPLLSGGHSILGSMGVADEIARKIGSMSVEQLLTAFDGRTTWLALGVYPDETVESALERLTRDAVEAVASGAQCLIVDDYEAFEEGLGWLDPHLAIARLDESLRRAEADDNLRRRTGIVIRSASIRTLHDIILLYSLGADAINAYAMLGVALNAHRNGVPADEQVLIETQVRLLETLTVGLEKVTSTMGCHELRGYGRVSSSIGLAPGIARIFRTANHFGDDEIGLTWERLNREAATRGAELRGEGARSQLAQVDRFYPKFWKKVESYANGEIEYDEVKRTYHRLSTEMPVALRHVLGLKKVTDVIDPDKVDISINGYRMPMLISAMSFGSQGELSYRSYADAAAALDIICINGEGGELPEMMGQYKRNRGQQVASGRFGVNAEFLNSAAVIEIKIGQGAKPGEGGMLPGYKVTPKVAAARHTTPYVTLLSPSNNHDLYSIEDLAQLIEELKTVNPHAKISVKCPVVPGIGVIAVGVAKAGADIVALSGYDGGTGAARQHALQYVGLPTEIGVIQAHRALIDAGIRDRVELWSDGGMKSGEDAVKMILLGANRVGFATMAMVAIGCTICRKCMDGTCHVGITTHIKTTEEAEQAGLPSFVPRVYDQCVHGIVRVFEAIGQEMRELTAQLGATRLQDLVGRADLLEQVLMTDQVDLSAMLEPVPMRPRAESEPGVGRRLTRPRNNLTRFLSELVIRAVSEDEREATYYDEVMAFDRALGSHLAGELVRNPELLENGVDKLHLNFGPSSVAGNGFAAWTIDQMDVIVEGGAQDGVAKGASGGRVAVM
ncbi:MAG: glutamate synthase [Anaerolineae bacterium]|nr:glutamate synthase [Anaerolineae bacterium]